MTGIKRKKWNMYNVKNFIIVFTGLIMIAIIVGTALLPIILSIATGNWLWMFLYAVTWTAVVTEVVIFSLIWAAIAELLS